MLNADPSIALNQRFRHTLPLPISKPDLSPALQNLEKYLSFDRPVYQFILSGELRLQFGPGTAA